MFSLPIDCGTVENISLLRRLREGSLRGGGGVVVVVVVVVGICGFSRMGFFRVLRLSVVMVGVGGLSLWMGMAGFVEREKSDTLMSSVRISSVSESEASVSDVTRGDPLKGASSLLFRRAISGDYPDVSAFCLFFLSSLNSSNFKSILLLSLTVFLIPLELTLLRSGFPERTFVSRDLRENTRLQTILYSVFNASNIKKDLLQCSLCISRTLNERG